MPQDEGFRRRLLRAATVVVAYVVVPGLLGWAVGGASGAVSLATGAVIGWVAARSSAHRLAFCLLPLAAIGYALGGLSSGTWWWIVVVTGGTALAGVGGRWQLAGYFTCVALVAVAAEPIDLPTDALLAAVFVTIGALGGYLATRDALRHGRLGPPPARADSAFGGWALVLAVAITAATAHVLGDELSHWIPMTVLALALPTVEGRDRHVWNRAVGTLLGLAAVVPVVLVAPAPALTYPIAFVCFLFAVAVEEPYWLRVALVTLLILLVAAPVSEVADVARRRLLFTLAGAAAVAVLGVAADQLRTARARRRSTDEQDIVRAGE